MIDKDSMDKIVDSLDSLTESIGAFPSCPDQLEDICNVFIEMRDFLTFGMSEIKKDISVIALEITAAIRRYEREND